MDDNGTALTAEVYRGDDYVDIYNTFEPDPDSSGHLKLGIPTPLRPAGKNHHQNDSETNSFVECKCRPFFRS